MVVRETPLPVLVWEIILVSHTGANTVKSELDTGHFFALLLHYLYKISNGHSNMLVNKKSTESVYKCLRLGYIDKSEKQC